MFCLLKLGKCYSDMALARRYSFVATCSARCDICRGFDPVAPVIHEWTYEAMAYDLLNMDGEVFRYEVETQAG